MNNSTFADDSKLIRSYQSGNDASFGVLMGRYNKQLLSYIRAKVRDRDEAEDLLQETTIKLWSFIRDNRYVEDGRFYRWSVTIARNVIIDYYRRRKNRDTVIDSESTLDYLNEINEAADRSNAMTKIIDDENSQLMQYMLRQLPDNQQNVVRMRIDDDMSFKEIANEENVGINTILARMQYAKEKLRKMYSEYEHRLCV